MSKKMMPRPPGKVPAVFRHFEEFVRQVVSVPKSEIDKREAEYRHNKTLKKQAVKGGSQSP